MGQELQRQLEAAGLVFLFHCDNFFKLISNTIFHFIVSKRLTNESLAGEFVFILFYLVLNPTSIYDRLQIGKQASYLIGWILGLLGTGASI